MIAKNHHQWTRYGANIPCFCRHSNQIYIIFGQNKFLFSSMSSYGKIVLKWYSMGLIIWSQRKVKSFVSGWWWGRWGGHSENNISTLNLNWNRLEWLTWLELDNCYKKDSTTFRQGYTSLALTVLDKQRSEFWLFRRWQFADMVGLNIPIHLEGGDSTSRASPGNVSASRLKNRSVTQHREVPDQRVDKQNLQYQFAKNLQPPKINLQLPNCNMGALSLG